MAPKRTAGDLLVMRADGGHSSGLGHLVRSLALAQAAIAAGWHVLFVTAEMPAALESEARDAGIEVHRLVSAAGGPTDAIETVGFDSTLTVVDGYHFDAPFFAEFDARGYAYAVIADADTAATSPRAVINQNPSACPEMYTHLPSTTALLLGLDYALLRPKIRAAVKRHQPENADVFLAIGGSDSLGFSVPLAEALSRQELGIRVALGDGVRNRPNIASQLMLIPGVSVLPRRRFVAEMAGAALAVIGAGSTMWEAAHLGIPTVALVVADNQVALSMAAERLGFVQAFDCRMGVDLGEVVGGTVELLADPGTLAEMSRRGHASVDGLGCERVADHLERFRSHLR